MIFKSHTPLFVAIFLLITLSACSFTVYRELSHKDFTMQYPNWKDYTLQKYEDSTFKIITEDKKATCQVQVVSYKANYLSIVQVILDTVTDKISFTLLDKEVGFLSYTMNTFQGETTHCTVKCNRYKEE